MSGELELSAVLALVTFLFGISYVGMGGIWKSIADLKHSVNDDFSNIRERVARLEERCGRTQGDL